MEQFIKEFASKYFADPAGHRTSLPAARKAAEREAMEEHLGYKTPQGFKYSSPGSTPLKRQPFQPQEAFVPEYASDSQAPTGTKSNSHTFTLHDQAPQTEAEAYDEAVRETARKVFGQEQALEEPMVGEAELFDITKAAIAAGNPSLAAGAIIASVGREGFETLYPKLMARIYDNEPFSVHEFSAWMNAIRNPLKVTKARVVMDTALKEGKEGASATFRGRFLDRDRHAIGQGKFSVYGKKFDAPISKAELGHINLHGADNMPGIASQALGGTLRQLQIAGTPYATIEAVENGGQVWASKLVRDGFPVLLERNQLGTWLKQLATKEGTDEMRRQFVTRELNRIGRNYKNEVEALYAANDQFDTFRTFVADLAQRDDWNGRLNEFPDEILRTLGNTNIFIPLERLSDSQRQKLMMQYEVVE